MNGLKVTDDIQVRKWMERSLDGVLSDLPSAIISGHTTRLYAETAYSEAQRLYNLGEPWLRRMLNKEFPEMHPTTSCTDELSPNSPKDTKSQAKD
jgi:hypothetical protein